MYFLKFEELEIEQYRFVYRDLETEKDLFVSKFFSSREECEDAGKKHSLYLNSEVKYYEIN